MEAAKAYASQWAARSLELERLRLHNLRAMTEADSALLFAQRLSAAPTLPLRPGSGLVEQQRLLARLRHG